MFFEIEENLKKPFPVILVSYASTQEQGSIVRPQGFRFHHFMWVTEGEGEFETEGKTLHISAGNGVFLKKDCPHSYRKSGETFSTAWCTFLGGEEVLSYYGMENATVFKLPDYFDEILRPLEMLSVKGSTPAERSAICYSWMMELLDRLALENISPVQRVKSYVENNFATPITLDELAKRMEMDKFAICRLFKKEYGDSVMNYMKKIRISKAKHYLKYTAFPIHEIGLMCGFESHSYFGKIFREETGVSPKEYRNRKRES
ncbi:MAG: helix-turn-helix transcriptional regulator [Clostridia bacterium]|nr:helix-turn-helix transcriptional regulator [Clostridia bacterium]